MDRGTSTRNPITISPSPAPATVSSLTSYRQPYSTIPRRTTSIRKNKGKGKGKGKEEHYEHGGGPTVRVCPASTSPEPVDSQAYGAHDTRSSPPSTSSLIYFGTSPSPPVSECDEELLCGCDFDDVPDVADISLTDTRLLSQHRDYPERTSFSTSSSTSSLDSLPSFSSSLSPNRVPLFDDDSGEESEEDDDASVPVTPPPPRMAFSPSSAGKKASIASLTTTDPLLSPPSGPHFLTAYGDFVLPSRHSATRLEPKRGSGGGASGPPGTTTSKDSGKDSLLTKSLRSLTRLPNLSLPSLPVLPTIRIPVVSTFDIDGLPALDDNWRGRRSSVPASSSADPYHNTGFSGNSPASTKSRRKSSVGSTREDSISSLAPGGGSFGVDDFEAETMAVQLETFAPPSPPSPRKKKIVELPSLPAPPRSLPVTPHQPIEQSQPSHPRIISNQRHLLMLSLEISMIRKGKLNCPLRPRAAVLRQPTERAHHSPLRREVRTSIAA